VVDPLGGSYYVEKLTGQVKERAREYIQRIDELGGAVAAIEQGYIQREIQESALRFQQEVESQQRAIVGVNRFGGGKEKVEKLFRVDPSWVERQKERTRKVRAGRDKQAAKAALKRLERAAHGNENTMPVFIECAEAYCTLGEMCDVLRAAWGEMREIVVV